MFNSWPEAEKEELVKHSQSVLLAPAQYLFKEGDVGDSLYILINGAIRVTKGFGSELKTVTIVGGGEILGEMALLTGEPRSATLLTVTSVSLLRIERSAFMGIAKRNPVLLDEAWTAYGRHSLDNYFNAHPHFLGLGDKERQRWVSLSQMNHLEAGEEKQRPEDVHWLYVINGSVIVDGMRCTSSHFIELGRNSVVEAVDEAKFFWLPKAFSGKEN